MSLLSFNIQHSAIGIIFTLLAVISFSCKKQEKPIEVLIKVISPVENTLYVLPGVIHAEINIESSEKLNYIRVCVCNSQQTPLFAPMYFYPADLQTNLSFDYILDEMLFNPEGPIYFLVTASGIETVNSFTQILIESLPIEYTGFYLFTRPTVNETKTVFVDLNLAAQNIASVSGDYSASAASSFHDMIYLQTKIPDRVYAKQFDDEDFSWMIEPTADFPELTSLCENENKVYCGYGNGKIAGFSDISGNQLMSTPAAPDSFAEKIIVTDRYIIADYKIKNKNSRSLSVFYKMTGNRFQKTIHYDEVVDFYTNSKQDEVIYFGNEEGKAFISHYFIGGNFITGKTKIVDNPISSSCRVSNSMYLFGVGNTINSFSSETFIQKEMAVLNEEIIAVDFVETEQVVVATTSNKVIFYSYPAMQQLQVYSSAEPIKGIEIRNAY